MFKPDISRLYTIFYKSALTIYRLLKYVDKYKRGPKFKLSLLEQILLTLFKLKYNLPDRILESLFDVDHVTISRCILRISGLISALNIKLPEGDLYIVDTTTIRIGHGKTAHTYSGYKHHHGLKYQCIIDSYQNIVSISNGIESSIHDKKIFETKYTEIFKQLNKKLTVLGDKAYVGLSKFNVTNPLRHNELLYKQDKTTANINNRALSTKRIQVEHVFARLKTYRILTNVYYYTTSKLDMFMKAICNIYNLTHNTA